MADLIEGLQAWRSGVPSTGATAAFQAQSLLGWDVALDGWLAVDWRLQQEDFWATWRRKKSSKRWITELIKKLWEVAWDMWEHRNGILHSSTPSSDEILDSHINTKITLLHTASLCDLPRDAFTLFQTPLSKLLCHPRHYKEKWLASVEAAKERKRHHDFGAYLPEQRFMRRWLGQDDPAGSG